MRDETYVKPVVDCSRDKIRTKQHFKNQVDINTIMSKYIKTGVMSQDAITKRTAVYADVSDIGSFQECHERVIAAQAAFMTLTPELRSEFKNDPGALLDFVAEPENRDKAIELGIIPKPDQVPTNQPGQEPTPKPPEKPPEA